MAKKRFYAVSIGQVPGIYNSWEECKAHVSGFSSAKYKGFATLREAEDWYRANGDMEPSDSTNFASYLSEPDTSQIETIRCPEAMKQDEICEKVIRYCSDHGFAWLSDEQKRAVQTVNGKVLLFAVPGSGKTTVIIARTGYMVHACGISPQSVISLTFTKAAAMEMSNRYKLRFPDEPENGIPDFRTIHSFCWAKLLPHLRGVGYVHPRNLVSDITIEDDNDEQRRVTLHSILKEVLKGKVKRPGDEMTHQAVLTVITSIKNRMLDLQDLSTKTIRLEREYVLLAPIYCDYEKKLREYDCMDFDDMLRFARDGLKKYPAVLRYFRQRYRYWSIDEAQDNSRLQHELMNLLSGDGGNLFMVGDDDQSIYGFRGAEPRLLLDFGHRADVNAQIMSTNYRSGELIVSTAKRFIEQNAIRANKQMHAFSDQPGQIRILANLPTQTDQYAYILQAARECSRENNTLAVIYRQNASCLPLMFYLWKNGVGFRVSKEFDDVINGRVVKDILNVMRFAVMLNSYKRFNSCKHTLKIFLKNEESKALEAQHKAEPEKHILDIIAGMRTDDEFIDSIYNKRQILADIAADEPYNAVRWILKRLEYMQNIESLDERLRVYGLLSTCLLFDALPEFLEAISQLRKQLKSKRETVNADEPPEDDDFSETVEHTLVTLSSMHAAKGLEFDRVVIIDSFAEMMNADSSLRRSDQFGFFDAEEERRLFYVALTRARSILEVLAVQSYHGNYERASGFIRELAAIYDEEESENATRPQIAYEGDYKKNICLIEPVRFYGVQIGRCPGVYTVWDECQQQVHGFSGGFYKSFQTRKEAEAFAFPNGASIQAARLNSVRLGSLILKDPVVGFNAPMDLPKPVEAGILEYLNVNNLSELTQERICRLREQSDLYTYTGASDYDQRTEGYTAVYLPVNFFKVWMPLWKLLGKDKLPRQGSILELGTGPGTTTLGLLSFYNELALDNPSENFALDYTVVERETGFIDIFKKLTSNYQRALPQNLKVDIHALQCDAFEYMSALSDKSYDLILESNLLNTNEQLTDEAAQAYIEGLNGGLSSFGSAILIEPGKNEQLAFLNHLAYNAEQRYAIRTAEPAEKLTVDISGIAFLRDAIRIGLRYTQRLTHWFSYVVLEREQT